MSNNEFMRKKDQRGAASASLLVVAVVTLLIGGVAGYLLSAGPSMRAGYEKGLAEGRASARAEAAATVDGAVLVPGLDEIKNVSGTVRSVGTGLLVIAVENLQTNPLRPPTPSERTVRVGATTTIVALREKDAETQQREQAEFEAALAAYDARPPEGDEAAEPPLPPTPFETVALPLAEITVGSFVTVTAESDIKDAATIDATRIEVRLASAESVDRESLGAPFVPEAAPAPEEPAPQE